MQPKDKIRKFRKETRYPHHRSEGLHPKRARRLMRKVRPKMTDSTAAGDYFVQPQHCTSFRSVNGGPMVCTECGEPPAHGYMRPCISKTASSTAHLYESRTNMDGKSYLHCTGCGQQYVDGVMPGELGCPGRPGL